MTTSNDEQLVRAAERIGVTPNEWRDICDETGTLQPLSAAEWREAMLSTLETST